MTITPQTVLDEKGRIMFRCGVCGAPITRDDFFFFSLRLPEPGESAGDYQEAELLDSIDHPSCNRSARAG